MIDDTGIVPGTPAPQETGFDWAIYADATFAGLSVLIPIPLLDWVFEQFFRRRMLPTIARRQGRELPPDVRAQLGQSSGSCLGTCLSAPLAATFWLLKSFSRKLLYFLTIKDATDQLAYYWQRAFLMNHILASGNLGTDAEAVAARQAMDQVLDSTPGPVRQLAQQVIELTTHVLRTVLKLRRGKEDEVVGQVRSRMSEAWASVEGNFTTLAARYDAAYQQVLRETTGTRMADERSYR
jgi:hypothetical protein